MGHARASPGARHRARSLREPDGPAPMEAARTRDAPHCPRPDAVVSANAYETPAGDDQQARTVRLPLLGKGAVSAHPFEHPLAAQMDDKQHWPPTCFEEKQGTSPLLLPLRPRL